MDSLPTFKHCAIRCIYVQAETSSRLDEILHRRGDGVLRTARDRTILSNVRCGLLGAGSRSATAWYTATCFRSLVLFSIWS